MAGADRIGRDSGAGAGGVECFDTVKDIADLDGQPVHVSVVVGAQLLSVIHDAPRIAHCHGALNSSGSLPLDGALIVVGSLRRHGALDYSGSLGVAGALDYSGSLCSFGVLGLPGSL